LAFSLLATATAKTVFDLKPEELAQKGITLLLADLDNTLTPYSSEIPTEEIRVWKEELERHGITLFVVSNSRKSTRVPNYCKRLGISFVRHAGKPSVKGFAEALEKTGRRAEEALMVGDQIFTDVLGANRAGIRVVLVDPIELAGNPGRYLRYGVEIPFRALSKKGRL